jgi:hypothetical protein
MFVSLWTPISAPLTIGSSFEGRGEGDEKLCIGMSGGDVVVAAGPSNGCAAAVITWDALLSSETRAGSSAARVLPMISAPAMFLFIFWSSSFGLEDVLSRKGELGGVSKAIECKAMQVQAGSPGTVVIAISETI